MQEKSTILSLLTIITNIIVIFIISKKYWIKWKSLTVSELAHQPLRRGLKGYYLNNPLKNSITFLIKLMINMVITSINYLMIV